MPRSEFGSCFGLCHALAELVFSSLITGGDVDCVSIQLRYLIMDKYKNFIVLSFSLIPERILSHCVA